MLNRVKFKLPSGSFYKNVMVLARGTTIAQALPILISPILTRIYTPEDFGVLAIYVALMSMLVIVSTGRYELAIMLPKKNTESIQLLWLAIFINFIFSLVVYVLLIFGFQDFSRYLGLPLGYDFIIYFLPVSIFIIGVCQSINGLLNRNKKYREMSFTKILNNLGGGITQISLFNYSGGLLIGYIAGQFVSLCYLVFTLKNKKNEGLKTKIKLWLPDFRIMFKLAYEYRVFPKVNAISSLLNTSSVQLIPLLLTSFFSSITTGFYSLSQRILQMPMSLLGSSIALVYFQKANEIIDNKEQIKKLTLDVNKKLLLIGLFPILITLVFGDYLFSIVFGKDWIIAGVYAQYLAPWIYLVFISSPLSHLLTVLGKQKELLLFNAFLFVTRIGWLLTAYLLGFEPGQTIFVHACIGFVAWLSFVYYVMSLAEIKPKEVSAQLFPFASLLFLCSIMGIYI
ncbi:oligosaccharide flippase family protein [Vibrio alfacsensis]|uniref:oligosaccharide flippase family protein n=1 Tax=Vibrio alfacsensis TaxID=1074311 RepID=UPI001BF14AC0|nr:oligosaccharide flippase family protein [Vibrio alfacsensis]BCN23016.1 polysaccharide biosynthesis protein [Vibrio alfacsensis]